MTTIDAVRDPHWAVVLQILSPRSSSLRSGPSLALERGFPATSRNELKDGCTTLKWNRWRDVGQAGSLRATQRVPRLPPLSAAIAAVGRLTIGRSLPSCPTGAPPAWRTTYAQMQALLLMNRAGVHFCVAHPSVHAVPTAAVKSGYNTKAVRYNCFTSRKGWGRIMDKPAQNIQDTDRK